MSAPRANRYTRVRFRPLDANKIPPSQSRSTAVPAQNAAPRRPEWTTRCWERRVEAEARFRLRQTISGLGAQL